MMNIIKGEISFMCQHCFWASKKTETMKIQNNKENKYELLYREFEDSLLKKETTHKQLYSKADMKVKHISYRFTSNAPTEKYTVEMFMKDQASRSLSPKKREAPQITGFLENNDIDSAKIVGPKISFEKISSIKQRLNNFIGQERHLE
jgi:hypothetical protein